MEKQDIRTSADVYHLVDTFYNRLLEDERVAYIFTDVAKIDLVVHLPLISSFWESALLGTANYRSNAMRPHLELHQKTPLKAEHFQVWLGHWSACIDELFVGDKAEEAKVKAKNIAAMMQFKISAMG